MANAASKLLGVGTTLRPRTDGIGEASLDARAPAGADPGSISTLGEDEEAAAAAAAAEMTGIVIEVGGLMVLLLRFLKLWMKEEMNGRQNKQDTRTRRRQSVDVIQSEQLSYSW